jgi:hypothetical protein
MVPQGIETIRGFDVDRPEKRRSLEWKTRRTCLCGCSVPPAFLRMNASGGLQTFDLIR